MKELDLSYNRIGPDGAAALFAPGVLPKSMTTLDLTVNELGNDVVKALRSWNAGSKSLTSLNLGNNDTTPRDPYGFNAN
jgi:Leucine-rich repeat (LRR) protein